MMTVNCPKCDGTVVITRMNCKIFRHAIYKNTGKQVGPHSKNKYIQKLIDNGKIYGCGCQFRIVNDVPEIYNEEDL
jgi:hypothetical protein